jgi:hypothetical protein
VGRVIRYASYQDYVEDRPIKEPIIRRECLTDAECRELAVVEHRDELTRPGRRRAVAVGITAGFLLSLIPTAVVVMLDPLAWMFGSVFALIGISGGALATMEDTEP